MRNAKTITMRKIISILILSAIVSACCGGKIPAITQNNSGKLKEMIGND